MTTATLDEGVFDYLTSHAGLAALIGTRLHPDYFSEDEELPAIAYSLEDERSMPTQQGPSALRQAIYRFDIWTDTAAEAVGVMKQMCAALDGYRGSFKDLPIVGVFFDGAGRSRDPDTQTFNVSMRFTIHYQEKEI
jgi:hypothetical protein